MRSFADSDGAGVGDLRGITARLPQLAELGIDAVWLTPFYRSPMADGGYDVADYEDVDPTLGTLDDFDALLSTALMTLASRSSSIWCRTTPPTGIRGFRRHSRQAADRRSGRATSSVTVAGPTATSRPPTGTRTSVDRPGRRSPTASGTCTCSRPSNPISTGRTRSWASPSSRSCGSGSTRESMASASMSLMAWPRS